MQRSARMPVLLVGHGSPMNILADNGWTRALRGLGQTLPKPRSVLVVSAHWETSGTQVLHSTHPRTIHDFYGFPDELYQKNYPAPGALATAEAAAQLTDAQHNASWGFDHGTWAVLLHLFPEAKIPATQLSLNRNMTLEQHYQLGRELKSLREQGVLIIGSGNLVHNLSRIDWNENAPAHAWARDFDEHIKAAITNRDDQSLWKPDSVFGSLMPLAHPTLDHYLPLLYVLGASDPGELVTYPFEGIQNASISMRTVLVG